MPTRQRLAKGIFQDAYGIAVIYSSHGAPVETRFPLGTPLDRLQRWRRTQQGHAAERAPRDPRGSLARDCVRFLTTRKGRANYKTEKTNLRAWIRALANPLRWRITPHQIDATMAVWREQGYSPQTLRHRFRILRQLFQTLDGKTASSPFRELTMPSKPKARPVSVGDDEIAAVAQQLYKQEILHRQDGKTRARFLVLATTGRRPAELKRTERQDVDVARRLWFTRTAKGGVHSVLILNEEQLAAWDLFVRTDAWGAYDTRSFSATIQRAGWPKGIRVYNVRHSVASAIRRGGGDARDVQDQLGHASIATGQFYFGADPDRQEAVSAILDHRLGVAAFMPAPARLPRRVPNRGVRAAAYHEISTTISPEPQAKPHENRPHSEGVGIDRKRRA